MKQFRASILLVGILIVASAVFSRSFYGTATVANEHRHQLDYSGQYAFSDFNISEIPDAVLPKAMASNEDETLRVGLPEMYNPDASRGPDDYHCFLINPKLSRDAFVTSVKINPDNKRIVHHAILYRFNGENAQLALAKDKATNGKGWTCFGGPNVVTPTPTSTSLGGSWLGAWAPGAGDGRFPDGLAMPLPKDSIIVMQMHYNLSNSNSGEKLQDQSVAEIGLAPEGAKLQAMRTTLLIAPVEMPCPDEWSQNSGNDARCKRTEVMAENQRKFGVNGTFIPTMLLSYCNKKVEDYSKNVGDASAIKTFCDRNITDPQTIYSVAGHMHLRGRDIRIELNPGTGRAKTLLHIPKWDFHWQGNYWLKNPVQLQKGDVLRVSCSFDNSALGQPMLGDEQVKPRYIVWGEGTEDEMCLGVVTLSRQ